MDDPLALVFLTAAATLRVATPLILCAMGGLFSERSGIIDVGLEGKMLMAAFFAAAVAAVTGSAWWGVAAGIAAAEVMALLHGLACITYRGNQVVSGVAINILAAGLTVVLGQRLVPARRPDAGARRAGRAPAAALLPARRRQHPGLCRAARRCRSPGGSIDAHALRPAPARRRRDAAGGRHRRHLGGVAALSRRAAVRPAGRPRRQLYLRSPRMPASAAT